MGTAAARTLATTTKSVPQMQEITSRWLLRVLPWVEVSGGVFRLNRRLTYTLGDGKVTFIPNGATLRVIPQELRELALLSKFEDEEVLAALAGRFVQRELAAGEPELPHTFVDYESSPREYELSVSQTVLPG